MGFLATAAAAAASAVGSTLASVSAATGIGATTTAATAATATAAATAATTTGTVVGGLSAISTLASTALAAKTLIGGSPKVPTFTPPPATIPLAAQNAPASRVGKNTSLAALSPGLALSGTSSVLGGSPSGQQKTLLGQ